MSAYRISQLAERSGVPATTLRFYETAGLLSPERTAGGYRTYDATAVERLAFISSAKLLGLALEDISALLEAWDSGACATVRVQMLPLIEERITDADRRVAELHAFSASLTRAKTDLSKPAPAGGCGPDCGCITTPADGESPHPRAVPVTLSRTRPVAETRPRPGATHRSPARSPRPRPVSGRRSGRTCSASPRRGNRSPMGSN